MDEKRSNHRLLCAELVELMYRDPAGYQRMRIVNLEDISASGMCLQSDARVPEGAVVRVKIGNDTFEGEIRYCEFRDYSYFVGVEFSTDLRWSKQRYVPEHLIDPRELILGA